MYPFIHLGPLSVPTFGLMVALALLAAAYVMEADFRRRCIEADTYHIVLVGGLVALVGARLYSVLETPREFFARPWSMLFSRYGFTWFGAFLVGVPTLLIMARKYRVPLLEFLDASSPAAAVGYAIGRIGCLLAGDGDYGQPTTLPWGMSFPDGLVPTIERVHPTPIYEFLAWMAIAAILWHLGAQAGRGSKLRGDVFCGYMILTGVARFLVEFIRINPRVLFGLTNAQIVSVGCVILGAVLLWRIKSSRGAG
ncbi:MAG: prolipoprotein diacylglyceryl transferase [Candidatus Acidiferrales bacterium]|jgi:phosphatidylglycerol:prolipoprotein diacylglycerol transferase